MEYRKVKKILCIMIESNLLLNDEYVNWADEYILCHDRIEQWILELAFTKSNDCASKVLHQEYLSTNLEPEIDNIHADLYIASLLLRHILGHMNWQTFLLEAGYFFRWFM